MFRISADYFDQYKNASYVTTHTHTHIRTFNISSQIDFGLIEIIDTKKPPDKIIFMIGKVHTNHPDAHTRNIKCIQQWPVFVEN